MLAVEWFEFILTWFPQLCMAIVLLLIGGVGLTYFLAAPGKTNRELDKNWDHSED